ncbi:MAG: PIN domain-containing protein [bacterium]
MNPIRTDTAPDRPRLMLVDFENVPQVELSRLDQSFRIIIFVGASQKSVPIELVTIAQKLGNRVEWQKVSGDGRNALDFFIAWQLGRVYEKSPRPECFILSKDKGFDPLLKHLNANGLKCRRVASLHELGPAAVSAAAQPQPAQPAGESPNVKRVVEMLGKVEKRSRPRKRRTLAQAISALFQKKLTRQEIDGIIDTLFARQLISEQHNIVTYNF